MCTKFNGNGIQIATSTVLTHIHIHRDTENRSSQKISGEIYASGTFCEEMVAIRLFLRCDILFVYFVVEAKKQMGHFKSKIDPCLRQKLNLRYLGTLACYNGKYDI